MGLEYFKRPLLTGGMQMIGGSVDAQGADKGALVLPASTATATAAAQTLSNEIAVHFLTEGTSGAAKDFLLQAPPAVGAVKIISVNRNTSSDELQIHTQSTSVTFFGTTFNTATIGSSTAFPQGNPTLLLVGASATEWAAVALGSSEYWTFSATTGSTAQS